ncbi:sugar ABC transporter substrate-binding protein [Actinoplanes sp. NPDC049265]|uniref:sugar ABC transporter substrate-binding protein n=1 Tax=Actinoplanes sp. NPDC049265 TaxID=3363902 RepID=UPI00371A1D67
MRKAMASLAVFGLLATGGLSACTGDDGDGGAASSGGGTKAKTTGQGGVGVILPDEKSAQRWKTDDPKFLKQEFDKAGVPVNIQNAQGDRARFIQIGESMIESGVKVLMVVNLDSPSSKIVLDKAKAAGVKTIDYDRLTLNGGADFYVSFDNKAVGVNQGTVLKQCIAEKGTSNPIIAELNGSPTDNNATEFKNGYDQILQPMYDSAQYTKGPDQWVADWANDEAGVIFTQMLAQQPKIQGVLAANDGLANAVIEVLRKKGMAGKIPVTGQDATVQGLQNILTGEQCMTVFKNIAEEAKAAAKLATDLYNGEPGSASGQQKDVESGAYVPFVSLTPEAITKENINKVINAGFADPKEICKGSKLQRLCDENGISTGK